MRKFYLLFFLILFSLSFSYTQVINEIDADQSGSDTAEFIEILWTANTSLEGLVIVLFNGSDNLSYAAYDLDGYTTDANGYFVAGNTGVTGATLTLPSNALQNGADAIALYTGNEADFPNDTAISTTNLLDAIVYGTNDNNDTELLDGLGETVQYDDTATESLQLQGDGTYLAAAPTPNAENSSESCDLNIGAISTSCDAITTETDTYTATIEFSGGGTSTYTVSVDSGTVDLGSGNPSVDATGVITITGASEGVDVALTIQDSGVCDISYTIYAPDCIPSNNLPIYEGFDYTEGSNLVDDPKWDNVSSSTDEIVVGSGSLSYTGLEGSTGNHLSFDGGGSDPAISFTAVTSGEIFTSFIFSVTNISSMTDLNDGGYFVALGKNYDLRLWVRPNPDSSGNTFDIGFGDATSSPPFSSSTYTTNTNIFVVMNYNVDNGSYNLWINPVDSTLGESAPNPSMSGTDASISTDMSQFVLRQDSIGETPFMLVDELRIGTSWAEVTPTILSYSKNSFVDLALYPNPTRTGYVTIKSNNEEEINAKAFDILGKQVLDVKVGNNRQIDVRSLDSGIYILRLSQNNATVTKKLVIKE